MIELIVAGVQVAVGIVHLVWLFNWFVTKDAYAWQWAVITGIIFYGA